MANNQLNFKKSDKKDFASLYGSSNAIAEVAFSEAFFKISDNGNTLHLFAYVTEVDNVQNFDDKTWKFEPQPCEIPIILKAHETTYKGKVTPHETTQFTEWLTVYLAANFDNKYFKGNINFNKIGSDGLSALISGENEEGEKLDDSMMKWLVKSILKLEEIPELDKLKNLKLPNLSGSSGYSKGLTPEEKLAQLNSVVTNPGFSQALEYLANIKPADEKDVKFLLQLLIG